MFRMKSGRGRRKGVFEIGEYFGSSEKRNVVGIAISHEGGDLFISRMGGFTLCYLGNWGMKSA